MQSFQKINDPLSAAITASLAAQSNSTIYALLDGNCGPRETLTGSSLHKLALQQASAIAALPIGPKRIALAIPPGPQFLVALLACIYAGVEFVAPPFPTPGPPRKRFLRIIEDCRPSYILAAVDDIDAVQQVLDNLGDSNIRVQNVLMDRNTANTSDFPWPTHQARILQYTSGTSGPARAVCVNANNILANALSVTSAWSFSSHDHMLTWLPHHHDMGLFGSILTPLVTGFPISQLTPFSFLKRPSRWMEAASKTGATITGGPAFALRMAINQSDDTKGLDLTRLRGVFCGSEPIPFDLLKQFSAHFESAGLAPSAPFACYGLAEATLFVAGCPNHSLTPACGLKDDGKHQVRIVDPMTQIPVADGQEGEIWVSGPSVPSAYLDAPEESAYTFQNTIKGQVSPDRQWLRTGDLGRISDRSLHICGRIKDIVIANGANISAFEIEHCACESDPVLQGSKCAAFAFGQLDEGKVAILIEVNDLAWHKGEVERAKQTIRSAVHSTHGVELTDISFVKRGALPTTTSGKIKRNEARDSFIRGDFGSPKSSTNEVFA